MSYGFYFDMVRCIGCKTCQVVCKDRLDISVVGPRTRRVTTFEFGSYPAADIFNLSISCNHCDSPACVGNCPTGAMFVSEDGLVLHDDDACIGCKTCVNSCPYGAPQCIEEENLVIKCDTCLALRELGKNPVCVDSCPTRALDFGDIDDLKSKYGNDLVSELSCMPAADITSPNLLMKVKDGIAAADAHEVWL